MSRVKAAAAGAKWTIGCQIFVSLAQFVVSGITSRIFLPADFGGFAAAASLMGILTLLTTTGLPSFLLKENELSSNQIFSIRKIGAITGVLTGVFYLIVAPLWLDLLRAPEGGQYIVLMAAAQALGPIGGVESALLRRETNLKRDTVSVLLSFVASASVGLLAALSVRHAWVLAVPLTLSPLVLAVSSRCLQRQLYSRGDALNRRALFAFARKITTQNIGFMLLQQTPGWVVSSTMGAGALGNFSKGVTLAQMPATALMSIQSRIAQPHWRNAGGRAFFQDAVCDAALLSAGVAFPSFAVLAVNGPAIVNLWLGPGWEIAGSMTSTLAIGFAFSIPFTLMAGSFEMRGDFRPARVAQWAMAGTMLPCIFAMVLSRDVMWASRMLTISQVAAFVCLVSVVRWQNKRTISRLVRGLLTQTMWATVIGLSGLSVGTLVFNGFEGSAGSDLGQLAVAALVSGTVWIGTFRWHAVSGVLVRRGFKLPWLLRPLKFSP